MAPGPPNFSEAPALGLETVMEVLKDVCDDVRIKYLFTQRPGQSSSWI
jgi:hypothetical protein